MAVLQHFNTDIIAEASMPFWLANLSEIIFQQVTFWVWKRGNGWACKIWRILWMVDQSIPIVLYDKWEAMFKKRSTHREQRFFVGKDLWMIWAMGYYAIAMMVTGSLNFIWRSPNHFDDFLQCFLSPFWMKLWQYSS